MRNTLKQRNGFTKTKELTCEVVIEREEDRKAGYSVYCPDLPGCFSNGGSGAEAKKNMREAMELFLESLIEHGDPIPQSRRTGQNWKRSSTIDECNQGAN